MELVSLGASRHGSDYTINSLSRGNNGLGWRVMGTTGKGALPPRGAGQDLAACLRAGGCVQTLLSSMSLGKSLLACS